MAEGLAVVRDLDDPVGNVMERWKRPNGMTIERVRVPLGVIGIVYESRPNVTADAAALSLKAGNAAKVAWPTVAIAQDVAKETASIAIPTLVIGGEMDQVDTPAILKEEVISIIRRAQLEIVQGSGHLLPLEE